MVATSLPKGRAEGQCAVDRKACSARVPERPGSTRSKTASSAADVCANDREPKISCSTCVWRKAVRIWIRPIQGSRMLRRCTWAI